MNQSGIRSRWAAVGAAVAITLGAGGIGLVSATSPAGATAYSPIEPCRVADTRAGEFNVGDKDTPIGEEQTFVVTAHGSNGECTGASAIPAGATGVQLNITSLNATTGTFLAVWGSGAQPNVSSLNPQPGQPPIPNAVTTGLTGDGKFNIFNKAGSVDVIVDIVGFYSDHHHDDRYYTETEVDAALGDKANSADVYTRSELYTQSESNARFDNSDADIDFNSGSQAVTSADVVLASVTVDTPTSGYVVVNTGGYFLASNSDFIRCSITTGTSVNLAHSMNLDFEANDYRGAATTRGFAINKASIGSPSEVTYNFVCDNGGNVNANDIHLTATFTPDPDAFGFIFLPILGSDTESNPEDDG